PWSSSRRDHAIWSRRSAVLRSSVAFALQSSLVVAEGRRMHRPITPHAKRAPYIGWLATFVLASGCSANNDLDTGAQRPSSRTDGGAADASGESRPPHRPDAAVTEGPIFRFDAGRRPGSSDDGAAAVCSA